MAGFNQLVIKPGVIGHRTSLATDDGSAVYEVLQTFTPEEARSFGRQLIGAADTAETKAAAEEKKKKKISKRATAKKGKK